MADAARRQRQPTNSPFTNSPFHSRPSKSPFQPHHHRQLTNQTSTPSITTNSSIPTPSTKHQLNFNNININSTSTSTSTAASSNFQLAPLAPLSFQHLLLLRFTPTALRLGLGPRAPIAAAHGGKTIRLHFHHDVAHLGRWLGGRWVVGHMVVVRWWMMVVVVRWMMVVNLLMMVTGG